MRQLLSAMCAALVLCSSAAVLAQSSVRQRATEEIMPGVRVRGGGVSINVDGFRCDPPCAEGGECREVCRDGSCDARSTQSNPCRHCTWECVE